MPNKRSTTKKRIAVLISGSGTNLQALIDACENGIINAEIKVVVSTNEVAYGLVRAKKHNIATAIVPLKNYASETVRDAVVVQVLKEHNVDLVVLAGYLGIITPTLISPFKNKIINIHPALLPKFGGSGMYGINIHKAVIAQGEKFSGATVHYVDEGIDTGAIIAQESIPVLDSDTPETLQKRILQEIEHKLLVSVVAKLLQAYK